MKCINHPELDAAGMCAKCGRGLCIECKSELGGKTYCQVCADVYSQLQPGAIYGGQASAPSEDQKVTNNKFILPKKTKTAVMLMTVFVIGGVIVLSGSWLGTSMVCGSPCMRGIYVSIGLFLPYILATILICIKNRIAWIFAIIILTGLLVCDLVEMSLDIISYAEYSNITTIFIPLLLIIALSLIILICDSKNYFEMFRQR